MPDCTPDFFTFPSFDRRKIEARFTGGNVTSDGGILLLRAADQRLGLVAALDRVLTDPRDPLLITHPQADLLRQRIFGLALGYEDLNDHDTLRRDLAWQTALERDDLLASSPTLCRLEARANRQAAIAFHEVGFWDHRDTDGGPIQKQARKPAIGFSERSTSTAAQLTTDWLGEPSLPCDAMRFRSALGNACTA